MPTLPAINNSSGTKQSGVSLFEVTIVVFIMITVFAIALPRIPFLFETTLEREVKKFTALVHDLRMEAILNNQPIRITLDPEKKQYLVDMVTKDEKTLATKYVPHSNHKHQLPPPIEFDSISLNEEFDNDPFNIRKVQINIEPTGFIDLFTIHLHDKKNIVKVRVVNLTGKTEISLPTPYDR